ncbi:uncharacterized protein RJT21DRAFT_1469 [Scheffersomyces amazonensis]|uniref:uncharacterized protein n=1 Tax=Scheffersomyces amazonensis TaxID=1078765 RepID=UPI00315DFDF7
MHLYYILSLLILSNQVNALNILLSTSDSWVSKNVRSLYHSLTQQGHEVLIVAPLYTNSKALTVEDFESAEGELEDGGEFNHLLDIHQMYYKKLFDINNKSPKGVISKRHIELQKQKVIPTRQFGHDPLNNHIWYINSNPLLTMKLAMDIILPTYFPEFQLDTIIFGPNEGSDELLNSQIFSYLYDTTAALKIPVISASTQDKHHIYYQDEKYFNINDVSHPYKNNVFTKNLKFINSRIIDLLDSIAGNEQSNFHYYNVNFPSINHHSSKCQTTKNDGTNPGFKITHSSLMKSSEISSSIPEFKLTESDVITIDYTKIKKLERRSMNFGQTASKILHSIPGIKTEGEYDSPVVKVLQNCDINLEVYDV